MSTNHAERRQRFEDFFRRVQHVALELKSVPHLPLAHPQPGVRYPCPCCGYPTLDDRGGWDICWVCRWEDDGQDDPKADEVWGGPNGSLSLTDCRREYEQRVSQGHYFASWEPTDSIVYHTFGKMFEALTAMLRTNESDELSRLWQTVLDNEALINRWYEKRAARRRRFRR